MLTEYDIVTMLNEYLKSPAGKKMLKKNGITDFNYDVDSVPAEFLIQMKTFGERMADILFENILPVIPSFDRSAIIVGDPYLKEGRYVIDIGFDQTKVHRDSLWPTGYPDGLQNIVKLFSTGVHASNRVYGVWKGHTTEPIPSKPVRHQKKFIENSIKTFNEQYKNFAFAMITDNSYLGKKGKRR